MTYENEQTFRQALISATEGYDPTMSDEKHFIVSCCAGCIARAVSDCHSSLKHLKDDAIEYFKGNVFKRHCFILGVDPAHIQIKLIAGAMPAPYEPEVYELISSDDEDE